ncbi:hypothetical protein [Phaeobacter gallaeciensis]|uniref:hypothetical protein n=1 Tax=Phaeobacter gallaeciensis TaxID=60890 RepID=UPI00237F08E6|nr:hypothetical protein [Phaeobacter gallaeciensis]MDE4193115.1 hypothetical protein [Phaeobacter gallaeciensis]MDE4201444.1 hypothetical protein [Phaeobacter gallaeciensis]MDE4205624.1 hypothetical protein [Phaeobacter gallaeciensis]MDE4209740.1 hypothetical protein [Phaeobacter gallaeciensis]MDE4218160.1 hypothetical protein [Phaeobacter gallaeciensis]
MKTVLFSAYFSYREERMKFMSKVSEALSGDVRIVVLNLAQTVSANMDVVNAVPSNIQSDLRPLDRLRKILKRVVPNRAGWFEKQALGEFSINGQVNHNQLATLAERIKSFKRALVLYEPDHVFLWNQFNVFHRIAGEILKEQGIPFGFFHDGVLPGSIALDFDAEMGASWLAQRPEQFLEIPVSADDLSRAEAFIDGLNGDEANRRHVQQDGVDVTEALAMRGLGDRPVIFYGGQNDWHAGLRPNDSETALHSPIFSDSEAGLAELDRLGGEYGFAVIYKPHPLTRFPYLFLEANNFPNSVILNSVSINASFGASNLISTIASQLCYLAVLQDRPTLMLGRNQITGKGMTYDVNTLEELPEKIEEGQADPLAGSRRENLIRHVAQLEKSYLFDYATGNGDYYRRGVASFALAIKLSLEHTKDEVLEMQLRGEMP